MIYCAAKHVCQITLNPICQMFALRVVYSLLVHWSKDSVQWLAVETQFSQSFGALAAISVVSEIKEPIQTIVLYNVDSTLRCSFCDIWYCFCGLLCASPLYTCGWVHWVPLFILTICVMDDFHCACVLVSISIVTPSQHTHSCDGGWNTRYTV